MPGLTDTGVAAPSARLALWRHELAETVRLALPMALTQLGQVAMMTSDLALLGRLGDNVVAAVSLAHTVLFGAFVLGMGLVSAVAPLAAQAFGARKPRLVRRSLRVGLWAAVILGIPLTVAQLYGFEVLLALGQPETAARIAARYLDGLAWSLVPAWWFIALRSFMGSINRPEPGLWITLVAIPANFVLAYVLIHGEFGAPKLDVLGAGIATTLVNIGMCVAGVWVAYACRPFKKYRILGRFWRPDWPLMRQLLTIGVPMSGMFALEFGLFSAAALLMGLISTTALAAHQIALTVAAIIVMVPFGISMAATVRVGQAVGRREPRAAKLAGFVAIVIGGVFMAAMVVLVVATRSFIPYVFLGAQGGHAETVALASTLMLLGASFFVVDGVQVIAAGALRGLNDTRMPLLIAAVCFWVVGFTLSYGLAFSAGLAAPGIWIGLSAGLALYAVLLVWRFHALTRRDYLPDTPSPV